MKDQGEHQGPAKQMKRKMRRAVSRKPGKGASAGKPDAGYKAKKPSGGSGGFRG